MTLVIRVWSHANSPATRFWGAAGIDGPTDTEVFQAYVREILCPTLRPGDCVVIDNLGTHKNAQTLALIAATGATVRFLPAYSPDLNPIEMGARSRPSCAPPRPGPRQICSTPSPRPSGPSAPKTP